MKSIRALTFTVLLFAVVSARAQLTPMTPEGCFSSSEPMQDQGSYMYQSTGYCQQQCVGLGKAVMATTAGSNCWCGDLLPAASSKVTEDKCDSPCNGYNKQNCMLDSVPVGLPPMLILCYRWWFKCMVSCTDRPQEQCSQCRRRHICYLLTSFNFNISPIDDPASGFGKG